jgi:uncharacterized repeat protein (TIGR03803 family)
VILDQGGNLYGTTLYAGNGNAGTVFKLKATSKGAWKLTVIHAFGGHDGTAADATLIFDPSGNLYGTAGGGARNAGVVFKVSP